MKIQSVTIHNYRSIVDATFELKGYSILVGANNAGKSTVINALRVFYDDLKFSKTDDLPKKGQIGDESWIELAFVLDENEEVNIADKYKTSDRSLHLRRYFLSDEKVKANQSNIYAVIAGVPEDGLFYGAKNIGTAKCGEIVYVPALTTPGDQMKMTGPSPLRNMLNFMMKRVVAKSVAYQAIGDAFKLLNQEANQESGFLAEIAKPLNLALSSWNVALDMSVNQLSPEDISKSLVRLSFRDGALGGDTGFDLDKYGHGFQRSVIYELIRLSPTFRERNTSEKKEYNPDFTLILFEEPEAFLHPSQQENMAFHLRELGDIEGQQVLISTHSPIFVGKAADDLGQLIRVVKPDGVSNIYQLPKAKLNGLLHDGGDLLRALQAFVADPAVVDEKKRAARGLIAAPPTEDDACQNEQFSYQMWLDSDRASMFFADRVLVVEGATERALINYLIATKWGDFHQYRIFVADALGKFNFHRFMGLLEAFGITHGVLLDDDQHRGHHAAINELVVQRSNGFTLAAPQLFSENLEAFLGLPHPLPHEAHRKPLEVLKAVSDGRLTVEKVAELKRIIEYALALPQTAQAEMPVETTGADAATAIAIPPN